MVKVFLTLKSWHRMSTILLRKLLPLSKRRTDGQTYLQNICVYSAVATVSADWFEIGNNSVYIDKVSMVTRIYFIPDFFTFWGPAKSIPQLKSKSTVSRFLSGVFSGWAGLFAVLTDDARFYIFSYIWVHSGPVHFFLNREYKTTCTRMSICMIVVTF